LSCIDVLNLHLDPRKSSSSNCTLYHLGRHDTMIGSCGLLVTFSAGLKRTLPAF